jgi:hypothetical protein
MKRTCVLLAIGCVSLIGLSARAAQAQTSADQLTPTSAAVTVPAADTKIDAVKPATTSTAAVQDGKTVAQRDRAEASPQKPTFVRKPMVSRIFPAMWQ